MAKGEPLALIDANTLGPAFDSAKAMIADAYAIGDELVIVPELIVERL